MKKILICEDDEVFQDILTQMLENANFIVFKSVDGQKGIEEARIEKPDLIILDINLPDIDGFQICKILKKNDDTKQIPIIMLTSKSANNDVIEGLELGADDYIVKPVVPEILIARINTVLRRKESGESAEYIIKAGEITLDIDKRICKVGEKEIYLLPKEFEIMIILMQHKNKVMSVDYLLQTVWGNNYFGTSRTLDTTIERLRKKLGLKKDCIETIEKVGYMFNPDFAIGA